MASIEERVSRLEGGYDHLATKADLAHFENRLMRWILVAVAAAVAVLVAVERLWPT